jgi:hypothetical protein
MRHRQSVVLPGRDHRGWFDRTPETPEDRAILRRSRPQPPSLSLPGSLLKIRDEIVAVDFA